MTILQHTEEWVKGEVIQGKIMLTIGLLFLITFVLIVRSQNELLKGTLIPLGLILLILFGYGGFQVFKRPAHIEKFKTLHQKNAQKAITIEYEKAIKDHKNYTMLKKVWIVLIVLSALAYFFMSADYYKGMCIGFIVLFLITLIVDSILHQRLSIYLEYLIEAVNLQ